MKSRFWILDSSSLESDRQIVALFDRISLEVVILSDKIADRTLSEVMRVPYIPSRVDVMNMSTRDNRDLIIISYTSEPMGNITSDIIVYDASNGNRLFRQKSGNRPILKDVVGDKYQELILYFDYQEFEHPEAPFMPIVYSFNGVNFVQMKLPIDDKSMSYYSNVLERFVSFRNYIQEQCHMVKNKGKYCGDFLYREIEKASRQIDALSRDLK